MTTTMKLAPKGGLVLALGLVWRGTQPSTAQAQDGVCGGCVYNCPLDINLYCFENCGSANGGRCALVVGCDAMLAVECNAIQ